MKIAATPRAGAAQTSLTPARRTVLVKSARSAAADTARRIGLGAKEKLVVKNVIADADGTTHTRYERTLAGLPVLGGDLVVHDRGGRTTVTKANAARLSVSTLSPKITAAGATGKALTAPKKGHVKRAEVDCSTAEEAPPATSTRPSRSTPPHNRSMAHGSCAYRTGRPSTSDTSRAGSWPPDLTAPPAARIPWGSGRFSSGSVEGR